MADILYNKSRERSKELWLGGFQSFQPFNRFAPFKSFENFSESGLCCFKGIRLNRRRSVLRRFNKRTDTDDAEKKLLDGDIMGGSDLVKPPREQQVDRYPTDTGQRKQTEQGIAEKRRQARGKIAAQGRTHKKCESIDDIEIGNATDPLLRRDGVVDEVAGAERDSAPRKASEHLNQHEIGGLVRNKPKHRDQRGKKRAEPQDSHVADEIGVLSPKG